MMDFLFTGFQQANAVRQFAFDRVADDRSRSTVTVRADLTLARKYGILLQDLPLLCRRVLETADEGAPPAPLTFTEDDMIATQAAARKAVGDGKPPRRCAIRPRWPAVTPVAPLAYPSHLPGPPIAGA